MENRQSEKAFWRNHYESWQATKMTQKDYCKQKGIKLYDFKKWRKVLSKSGEITALNRSGNRSKAGISFAPVSINGAKCESDNRIHNMQSDNLATNKANSTEIELKLPHNIRYQ